MCRYMQAKDCRDCQSLWRCPFTVLCNIWGSSPRHRVFWEKSKSLKLDIIELNMDFSKKSLIMVEVPLIFVSDIQATFWSFDLPNTNQIFLCCIIVFSIMPFSMPNAPSAVKNLNNLSLVKNFAYIDSLHVFASEAAGNDPVHLIFWWLCSM